MSDSTGASADNGAADGGVPYENTADPVWGRHAFELYQRRELQVRAFDTEGVISAQIWGACPRCGHALDVQQTRTVPVPGLRGPLWAALTGRAPHGGPGIPDTVEVSCGCDHTHPGTPEQVRGCGVSFRLPTTPPAAARPGAPPESP